ncbi:hypothetical protein Patl1_28691 [Pistacia atlantica]|uniref:Uncharacterized protein n=1 Tax=Pistacia atlantica TaxID=434234 RepID=A0ACC1BC09_9ROSI|nr:hypothetical protein Patl1_28691 [Pistacia atlantica]
MASKASYENKPYIQTIVTQHWKMEFLGSDDYWNEVLKLLTQTHEVLTLISLGVRSMAWARFMALSWFTKGHSLGGALAILFAAILALHDETELLERLEGVYTFGQPMVEDEKFVEFMKKKLKESAINYVRFVYSNDIVPRLPFDDSELMFKHFGQRFYYNSLYKGQVKAPNKNYFSPLEAIPMMMNVVWELIKSFALWRITGADYRERGLMRVVRVIGLIIPGLSAHCPQDYINGSCLGSTDVLFHPNRLYSTY